VVAANSRNVLLNRPDARQAVRTHSSKLMKNVAYRLDIAYRNPISFIIRFSILYLKGLIGCVL
jgi:hypothetical protein